MTRSTRPGLLALALLAGLGGTARSGGPASPASVVDEAGLFRDATIRQAEALIHDLRRDYHFDVRIETLKSLPEDEAKQLATLSSQRAKNRFVQSFANDRAADADVDGLYVLVCTSPRFIVVTAYPGPARAIFSDVKQRELHTFLQKGLKGATAGAAQNNAARAAVGFAWAARPLTGPDAALLEALASVGSSVRERVGDPNAVRSWPIGVILLSGISVWLILKILSRRMAASNPDAGLFTPAPPDRTPGLLAARFGSPAAYWIYDRLFHGPPPAAPTPPDEGIVASLPAEHEPHAPDLLHPEPRPDHADAVTPDGPA